VSDASPNPVPVPVRPRRTLRIVLALCAGLVAALAALVALLPTLVSLGAFRGTVVSAIGGSVNGTVSIGSLRLGWSGPLEVTGLAIDDASTGTKVTADLSVEQGLWTLVTRGLAELDVRVSGSLRTTRAADGTLGIARLAREPAPGAPAAPGGAPAAEPLPPGALSRLPDPLRRARLALEGVSVEVLDAAGATEWAVRDLKGALAVERGADATVTLAGSTEVGGQRGAIDLSATFGRMVGADGVVRLAGSGAALRAQVSEAPVAAAGMSMRIVKARVDVRSDDLAGRVEANVDAEASIEGEPGAAVRAALVFDRLLAADGTPVVDLAAIHGSLEATSVPTRPFERFVAGSGIELARDAGPRIDLVARFADATGGDIDLSVRGASVTLAAKGSVDPQTRAATLRTVSLDGTLAPALLESVAQFAVSAPARLSLRATDVVVPAAGADGRFPIDEMRFAADATLALDGLRVPGPEGTVPLDVASIRATLRAAPVGAGVGFDVVADGAAARPAAPGAAPSPGALRAVGTLARGGAWGVRGTATVTDLPSALVQPFVPRSLPLRLAEDLGPVVRTVDVSISGDDSRAIGLRLDAPNAEVRAKGRVEAGSWRLDEAATVSVRRIRPALLAHWGVHVDAPLAARIGIARVAVPADGSIDLRRVGIEARVECVPADARVPVGVRAGAADDAPLAWLHAALVSLRSEAVGADASADVELRAATGAADPATVATASVRAKGLGDASSQALESARLSLGVRVPDVRNAAVAALVPAAAGTLAAMGASTHAIEATYEGTVLEGELKASVTGDAGDRVTLEASVAPRSVAATAVAAVRATPALVRHLAGDGGPALRAPAAVEVRSDPVSFARTATWSFSTPTSATVRVRVPEATVGGIAPSVGDLAVGDAVAKADVALDAGARVTRADVTLDAKLAAAREGAAAVPIAPVAARAKWSAGAPGEDAAWDASVALDGISGDGLGTLLALDEATRREVGTGARVRADARGAGGGVAFEAESTLERLRVRAKGSLRDGMVELADSTAALELAPAQALAALNGLRAPVGDDGKPRPPMWKDVSKVSVVADVRSLWMRTDGLAGMAARLDVKVGPVRLVPSEGAPVDVDGVEVAVDAPSPERPASVRVRSSITEGGQKLPLALDGTVAGWLGADGKPSADRIRIDAQLKAERASTRALGAVLGLGTDLSEAMGPDVTVEATVRSPAPGSADAVATVTSRYLTVRAPAVSLRDGVVAVAPAAPVVAEFIPTPPVRRHWLGSVNPVLRDIRLKDERRPIRLELTSLAYPLDGDRARLSGDVRLTVGEVLFERTLKNESLDFMNVFRTSSPTPVEGIVNPLAVSVRRGQLKYKDFEVGIERQGDAWKTRLVFDGDIDLVRSPPYARAITANYPLGSVARDAIGKLPSEEGAPISDVLSTITLGAGDAVMVGIKFYGPLGAVDGRAVPLRMTANLKFDGKAIEKGLQKAGERAIDAIGDLLRKKK
jgi:hypothetical protein